MPLNELLDSLCLLKGGFELSEEQLFDHSQLGLDLFVFLTCCIGWLVKCLEILNEDVTDVYKSLRISIIIYLLCSPLFIRICHDLLLKLFIELL